MKSDIKIYNDQLASMQEEMKTEFKRTLTNDELDRLDTLTQSIGTLKQEYEAVSIQHDNMETIKQDLEQEMRTTLYPLRDRLKSESVDEDDGQVEERRKELATFRKGLTDLLARQKAAENEVEKLAKAMRENQAKLAEHQVPGPGV